MSLSVVVPLTVTPEMLVSTDVPEADYPAWAAGTTYALGARVILDHAIYESLAGSNTGNNPATATDKWVKVSATNRWKAFDLVNSSRTAQSSSLYYEIKPGKVFSAIAALNMVGASSIRVRVTDPTYGLIYDKTTLLISAPRFSSWWDWFFADRFSKPQYVALDLPAFPEATIRIDLTGDTTLAAGTILLGQAKTIGKALPGARVGIRDYSIKQTNEWGDITLVQRAFARLVSMPVLLRNADKGRAVDLLDSLRATPTLWVGSGVEPVYGWYRDWEIIIAYLNESEMTIEIEGLI